MHPSIERYLEILQTKPYITDSLKAVRQALIHFIIWWEGQLSLKFDPTQLRPRDVRDWRIADQREDGPASATVNWELAWLRDCWRRATSCHLLIENSTVGLGHAPTDILALRSLSVETINALLHGVRTHQMPFSLEGKARLNFVSSSLIH